MSSKPGANLAQLPAELLVKILSWISAPINYDNLHYVENANFTNIASIKNLRLTCRRFENLTTPALFGIVTVLICEPQSIEALENVSRHSLLSRHVKAVRVQLGFYDALFAKNDTTLSSPTRTAVGKLVQSWTLPTHQQPDATDPDSSLSILAGIQAEYRDRYDRQEQMHGSGDAIRRIAQAMSRMPTATRLVLEDYPPRPWHFGALLVSVLDSNNVDQSRLAQLVFPLSWISCWRLKIDSVYKSELRHLRPRFEFVVDLPVAIHRAGVRLTALRVLGLQIPDSVPSWGAVDPASFQEACQSLQTLEVTPQYRNEYCNLLTRQVFNPWSTSFGVANTQQMPLSQIVDQICMLNLNLRHLHIDCASMEFYDDNDPDSHTCDRLFKSFRWPSLE